jgi:hypothetical protein
VASQHDINSKCCNLEQQVLQPSGRFRVVLVRTVSGPSLSSVPPTVKAVAATQSARLLACVRVQNIFGS